jgi:hypothetical protein
MDTTTGIDRSTQAREAQSSHEQELRRRDAQPAHDERERQRRALSAVLGIRDPGAADRLLDAGLSARAADAFELLPLVEMAWVDGRVEAPERSAVLEAALEAGLSLGSPAHQQLEQWLREEPPKALDEAWRNWISRDRANDLDERVLAHARHVAEAGGGFLGLARVSRDEWALLERIRRSLSRSERAS